MTPPAATFARLSTAVFTVALAGVGCASEPPVASESPVASPTSASAAPATGVQWAMDERSGRTMAAAGGQGPNGTVGTGVMIGTPGLAATGYTFPSPAPQGSRPDRLVTVSDSVGGRHLNPGAARITLVASVNTRGSGEYNVMQKGQARTAGGFYKIEINSNGSHPGRVSCTFGTGSRSFAVAAPTPVNDGRWHRLTCIKAASAAGTVSVSVTVDGKPTTRSFPDSSFAIDNAFPLTIGGKYACNGESVECDYFEGSLDQTGVTVG